jgi:hypothetical protein
MDDGALTVRDGLAALALAVTLLFMGGERIVPGVVGSFHDDAVYAVTAKSLAEGSGYRLINFPGAPRQTKYPILYPAVLAVVWRCVAGLSAKLAAMQLATLLAAALAIAGAYLYVVRFRYVARAPAFVAGIVCASSPNLLYYATQTLSEMPFALTVVASLWATDACLRGTRAEPWRAVLTGVVAGLPFLCRSAGAVVPLVALVMITRARRPLGWMLLGVALVALPWIAWTLRGAGNVGAEPIAGYQEDYVRLVTRGYGVATGSRLGATVAILGSNLVRACVAIGNVAGEGAARLLYAATEHAAIVLGLVGAAAWLAVAARGARTLLPTTLLTYLVLVCAWPWPPDRFMVPVLFLVLALAIDAAWRTMSRVASVHVITAVLSLVVLLNARVLADYARVGRATHYPYFILPDLTEPAGWATWSSYAKAFAWLGTHSTRDTVLAAGFDSMTALYTGRPTVRPFVPRPSALYYARETGDDAPALGTPGDLTRTLAAYHVRYLFVSPMPSFPEEDAFYELITRIRAERPALLRPVYWEQDPRFVVFEVTGP